MTLRSTLASGRSDFFSALQFLTRIPVPATPYRADALSRSTPYFPLIGALIGLSAALVHSLFAAHLARLPAAVLVVLFTAWLTGCLHEDGLADAADGLGGGWSREQMLAIMRDSRIGSYGAVAMVGSLLARVTLIAALPIAHVSAYLVVAHCLCRWSTLPLSYFLPPARTAESSQGARVAQLTTRVSLAAGTLVAMAIAAIALRTSALGPALAALLIAMLSGRYFMNKLGGSTGDCFGATNQITEAAVYLCGAWTL